MFQLKNVSSIDIIIQCSETMMATPKKPRKPRNPDFISWRGSEARCLIIEDVVSGALPLYESECTAEVAWDILYKDNVAFADVPFAQFKARLRDHRAQVKKSVGRSMHEEKCLMHDRSLFPRKLKNARGELVFDLHPAKDILREDVAAKKHVGIKPEVLWRSHPEYGEFDKDVFRGHLYQEIRRVKFINFLQMRREEEKELLRCKPPGTHEFRHPYKKQKSNNVN